MHLFFTPIWWNYCGSRFVMLCSVTPRVEVLCSNAEVAGGQDAKGSRGDGGGAFVVSDHHDDLAVYFLLSLTVPIRRLLIIINFPAFHSAAALAPNRFRD